VGAVEPATLLAHRVVRLGNVVHRLW
jgi:hypothetical protein